MKISPAVLGWVSGGLLLLCGLATFLLLKLDDPPVQLFLLLAGVIVLFHLATQCWQGRGVIGWRAQALGLLFALAIGVLGFVLIVVLERQLAGKSDTWAMITQRLRLWF